MPNKRQGLDLPRDRWATTVDLMRRYVAGEDIPGMLIVGRRWRELRDFMDLARVGPDPDIAMTDPYLFKMLREAGTKAYLSGLMHLRGPGPEMLGDEPTPPSAIEPD